MKLLQKCEQM